MNTVHLYFKPAPAPGTLAYVRSVFPAAGGHALERGTVPPESVEAWLTTHLAVPEIKAVYNCAGSGVTKPEGYALPWFDQPPGHPCEGL